LYRYVKVFEMNRDKKNARKGIGGGGDQTSFERGAAVGLYKLNSSVDP
jgi:hypothetical protein